MLVAAVITGVLALMQYYGAYTTTLNVPFIKQFQPDFLIHSLMGNPFTYVFAFLPFYLFFVLVVVGSSNAVNTVTDGLDGLCHRAYGDFRRRVDGALLYTWKSGVGELPATRQESADSRTDDFLRLADGGKFGLPLVECASGGHLHGRCRKFIAWWGDGRGRGVDQARKSS